MFSKEPIRLATASQRIVDSTRGSEKNAAAGDAKATSASEMRAPVIRLIVHALSVVQALGALLLDQRDFDAELGECGNNRDERNGERDEPEILRHEETARGWRC
jgi:hypothetical protein